MLLLPGDVCDELPRLEATLELLAARFGAVLFTPGNHELWCRESDRFAPRRHTLRTAPARASCVRDRHCVATPAGWRAYTTRSPSCSWCSRRAAGWACTPRRCGWGGASGSRRCSAGTTRAGTPSQTSRASPPCQPGQSQTMPPAAGRPACQVLAAAACCLCVGLLPPVPRRPRPTPTPNLRPAARRVAARQPGPGPLL